MTEQNRQEGKNQPERWSGVNLPGADSVQGKVDRRIVHFG